MSENSEQESLKRNQIAPIKQCLDDLSMSKSKTDGLFAVKTSICLPRKEKKKITKEKHFV